MDISNLFATALANGLWEGIQSLIIIFGTVIKTNPWIAIVFVLALFISEKPKRSKRYR